MNKIKVSKDYYWILWVAALVIICLVPVLGLAIVVVALAIGIHAIVFFKGGKFQGIKSSEEKYVTDCNNLNQHINELRNAFVSIKRVDYGSAEYQNISRYKYKKKGLQNARYSSDTYDCSRQVCDNARKQPFKYICKYFNIKENEESLEEFENVLNDFCAAEEGKNNLLRQKTELLNGIKDQVPWDVRMFFAKTFEKKLGFQDIALNTLYFPSYTFRYISSGGNSGNQFTVVMDISMMTRFVGYLKEMSEKKKSAKYQRALMTPALRQKIKARDNYTCQICGNSTRREPNLLLEIDHKIPVSKGGLSTEDNLQTLCWRCNRSKGAKLIQP